MKKRILIFVLALVILAEAWALYPKQEKLSTLELGVAPDYVTGRFMSQERERWSNIINKIGGEEAYLEFKKQYKDKNFGTQHMAAHVIGALLYQKMGVPGLAVCDGDFSFGCYHSFFAEILVDKGPDVIKMLDDACLEKFGPLGSGCQHGIGHGVMDYFGPRKLLKALQACEDTTTPSPVAGCTSGVFMEYNIPVIIDGDNATPTSRPVDEKNPYDPCPTLPKEFQASCYYSIGQWWNQTDLYRKDWKAQGILCKNIPEPSHMQTCYLGIGNVVGPDSGFVPEKSIESCRKMPDREKEIFCRAGTSWSFDANPKYRSMAPQMCEGLGDKGKYECMRLGHMLNPEN